MITMATKTNKPLKRGDKVKAMYNNGLTAEQKCGIVVDVLSIQVFIKFNDGSEGFAFIADKQLTRA